MRCTVTGLAVGVVWMGVAVGCGGQVEPGGGSGGAVLGWDEFLARTSLEEESGLRIVNGDELAEDDEQLRAAYERYLAGAGAEDETSAEDGVARATQPLVVNRVKGRDDRWSSTQAQD